MTVPVLVESQNGTFTASVLGNPAVKATGPTKDAAVTALTADLIEKQGRGELVLVNLPPLPRRPLSEEEIEATREMVAEIYRRRDRQKAREFPE